MDLILERFMAAVGETLDEDARTTFDRLLERSDQDILDWIAGRSPPPPETGFVGLVDRIRSASGVPDAGR